MSCWRVGAQSYPGGQGPDYPDGRGAAPSERQCYPAVAEVEGALPAEPNWERREDGSICSVQSACLANSTAAALQARTTLHQTLRQYFAVAERCTRRCVRVRWNDGRPTVTLPWPPVTLIAMGVPTVEQHVSRHTISVPVHGGLLAAPDPNGRLSLSFTHQPDGVEARVELDGYRPRGERLSVLRWLYAQAQARLHVYVGRRFLRDLQRG